MHVSIIFTYLSNARFTRAWGAWTVPPTVQDGWIEDVCSTKGSENERDGTGRIKSERLRQRGIDREGFAPIEIEGEG